MWQRSTVGLMAGSILAGFGGWIDFLAILTLAAYEYRADAFLMALISAALDRKSTRLNSSHSS